MAGWSGDTSRCARPCRMLMWQRVYERVSDESGRGPHRLYIVFSVLAAAFHLFFSCLFVVLLRFSHGFSHIFDFLRWCRLMTVGLSYTLPLQGMLLLLILRSSVGSLTCRCFKFRPVPSMRLCWLLPWMSTGNSFMLSHRVGASVYHQDRCFVSPAPYACEDHPAHSLAYC
jgi:hypothetical protein